LKKIVILPLCSIFLLAAPPKQFLSVEECNKIFEQRKSELALQLERIEEKEQALNAFQNANKNVQGQKEQRIGIQVAELNRLLADMAAKEKNAKAMLEENKKVLEAIQKAKDDKITQSYTKMKPSAAGEILSEMNASSAASVLFNLDAKKMADVLGKMEAKKAAQAVERLKKGPPF